MKRLLLILMLCLCVSSYVEAQKLLSVEETTEGIGVYPCGDRHEALVVFFCKEPFDLVFESNYDSELVVTRDSVAGVKSYKIVLITMAPGIDYSGRRITIKAPGFRNYTLPLNLRDKQKVEFTVSDPYSLLRSPFFLYQEKGNEKFLAGEYQGAKDYYLMVKACPEYVSAPETIDEHLALCDSMIDWGARALEYEHFGRYREAYVLYSKMLRVNSENEDIRRNIAQCMKSYNTDCDTEFTLAEHYLDQNELYKARDCYQRVIAKECYNKELAARELSNIESMIRRKETHARCFMYDFGGNLPIGFTYAVCHEDRRGGYFSFRMNSADIDLLAKKSYIEGAFNQSVIGGVDWTSPRSVSELVSGYSDGDIFLPDETKYETNKDGRIVPRDLDFEATISAGWVLNIWKPIYIHFTPFSYHGGGFYTFDRTRMQKAILDLDNSERLELTGDWDEWSTSLRNKSSKGNWYNAVAPEVGLIVKYWRVCAKLTYQYNYWLGVDDKYEDFFDDNVHKVYFGVGFCW